MSLIDPAQLGNWMGRTLDDGRAAVAVMMADGWLMAATRLDPYPDNPDTAPQDLWSWAMELAALAYVNNPNSVTQRQTGGVLTAWAPDALTKRAQILEAAKARYNRVGLPQGSFPPAPLWPDRADPWGRGGWVQYL